MNLCGSITKDELSLGWNVCLNGDLTVMYVIHAPFIQDKIKRSPNIRHADFYGELDYSKLVNNTTVFKFEI